MFVDPIDDERDLFVEYLVSVGFIVDTRTALDARTLDILRKGPPHALVVRARQIAPGSSVLRTTMSIRCHPSTQRVAIILMTTDGFSRHEPAFLAGCDAVLLLPVLPNVLADVISDLAALSV